MTKMIIGGPAAVATAIGIDAAIPAGAAVTPFSASRDGSRGPLARANVRCDHGDPICACGCAEVWVTPRGWACSHCDLSRDD